MLHAWSQRLPRTWAIALDVIPGDPEEASLVRGAQIQAIVKLTPLVMAASCFNATLLLATFSAMGALRPQHWVWALTMFAMAAYFLRAWRKPRNRLRRPGSRRAIRRLTINGALFGAVWGLVPISTFPGAPLKIQLFVACLTTGMMSAGAFALSAAPLAGILYVLLVGTGALIALLRDISPVSVGIMALLASYTAVLIVNINWSAALFVDSRLAEAQVRREVAAREEAQVRTMHAERMKALGELAGGIAHDFNNLLQVISGGAARIERRPEQSAEVIRQARRILDAVDLGSTISRRLLAFARRDALSAEPIDAAALVTNLGEMLTHAIGPSIRIQLEADTAPGCFLADRGQFETVLLNLAANARDAMPNGGDLHISLTSLVLDQDTASPRLNAGRYVQLSVADTGAGMDGATLARVTEPFFTTKAKGRGTGLGLSMAKGFAEQSGGALAIRSEAGRGTTVTVWLPEADLEPQAPVEASDEVPVNAALGAGRRVLVVDDEDAVREGITAALEDAGFVTLSADDAVSALAHFDRGAPIDALITDFTMPGLNGVELIGAVSTRRPGLPTILLTGHVNDVATDALRNLQAEPLVLLQKPIRPTRVVEQLVALMAAP